MTAGLANVTQVSYFPSLTQIGFGRLGFLLYLKETMKQLRQEIKNLQLSKSLDSPELKDFKNLYNPQVTLARRAVVRPTHMGL